MCAINSSMHLLIGCRNYLTRSNAHAACSTLTLVIRVESARSGDFYSLECRIRTHTTPANPQTASNGAKLARPCSPITCPKLNAPYLPDAASATVNIES